jgi:hypothetical protein
VVNCDNRSTNSPGGISFHSFPDSAKDKKRFQNWVSRINRADKYFKPEQKNSVVCSIHFRLEDFKSDISRLQSAKKCLQLLNIDAVPSLLLGKEKSVDINVLSPTRKRKVEKIVERSDRAVKRQRLTCDNYNCSSSSTAFISAWITLKEEKAREVGDEGLEFIAGWVVLKKTNDHPPISVIKSEVSEIISSE